MKTYSELLLKSELYLKKFSNDSYDFRILKVIDFKEGLLIIFQSKEFVEENSEDDLILGLKPFIIDKVDGSISHKRDSLITSFERIEEFRKEKGYLDKKV